jgi:hypothetical protein
LLVGRDVRKGLIEDAVDIGGLLRGGAPGVINGDDVWISGGSGPNEMDWESMKKSSLLQYDEMDIKFNNTDMYSISNIGFLDGTLHIQIKIRVNGAVLDYGHYLTVKFINRDGNVVFSQSANVNFFHDKKYGSSNHINELEYEYNEIIYEGVTDPKQLDNLTVAIDYMEYPKAIEGNWSFTFMIPDSAAAAIPVGREISINGDKVAVDSVFLSPLALTVHLHRNMSKEYMHSDEVYVEYADGSTVKLDYSYIQTSEGDSTLIFGGGVIEAGNAVNILINGETIGIP